MAWKPFRPGAIKESLLPETTEQVNLGSNAKKWLTAFIVTLTIATFTLTGRMTTGGYVNMTGVLFVDNATSRVGIGTTTPADTLHVSGGDIRVQRATGSPGLEVQDSDRTWFVWSDPSLDIFSFGTGSGVTSLAINTLGNVGIGTTTSVHKLEVAGSMNVSGDLNVSGFMALGETGYNWALLANPSGTFVWSDITSDASRITINASGHVNIGINMSIAGLNGVGNGFACINSVGDIYRSASACA